MSLRRTLFIVKDTKILQRTFVQKAFHTAQKKKGNRTLARKLFTVSSLAAMGIWGFSKKKSENESNITTREVLIAKADALYDQEKFQDIYKLLINYKDSKDVDILWRLCRAMYKMSKVANEVDGKTLIFDAYDTILDALNIRDDHWAVHKWASILLNTKTVYEGTKAQIKESYTIKKHMLRAVELNSKDPTLMYMLGTWCYQVAELTWYQRKIASVIFGDPPTSSFQEALKYFQTAEDIDPNFYSHNLLMLGKTYLKLNQTEQALKYLNMAVAYPAKNDDDRVANQEAQKILQKLKQD